METLSLRLILLAAMLLGSVLAPQPINKPKQSNGPAPIETTCSCRDICWDAEDYKACMHTCEHCPNCCQE